MTRRTLIATAVAVAAMAVPSAASAQYGSYDSFETPSGNIVCATDGDVLACDIRNRGITVSMDAYSRPQRFWSDGELWSDGVLPYGFRLNAYPFTCASQRSGLTCRSRESGHGFFLSRTRIRTW